MVAPSRAQIPLLRKPQLALPLALFFAGSMWFYVQRIMIPHQQVDAQAHQRPRGNLSDLYPRWVGTRELLMNHRDPYSPEVTREIQAGYYGRALEPDRPGDPKDQQRFAYPLYVVFLLAPAIHAPFPAVQATFLWLLVVVTAASVLLWLRVVDWRPSWTTVAVFMLLTLGSFPAVQGLKLQQLSLLVNGLLAICLVLFTGGQLFLAGVLLAVTTIKPQLTVPLVAWLLLWALSRWRERQAFVWGFALTMSALLGGAQLLLPGWIARFREGLIAYRQYTGGAQSALEVLITPFWGQFLDAALLVALFGLCWHSRRAALKSREFALTTSLVLAVTVVIIPMVAPYNQLLLLPALFLLVRDWDHLWRRQIWLVRRTVEFLLLWPWFCAAALTLAYFVVPAATVQRGWAAPIYTSLGLPMAVVALLLPQVASLWAPAKLEAIPSV